MPPKKEGAKTTASTARKTTTRAARTTTASKKQIDSNARHIEENAKDIKNNSNMIHMLYGIIIVLLLIIAGLAFFVGTKYAAAPTPVAPTNIASQPANTNNAQNADITVRVIDDSRCSDCQTEGIAGQLKKLPFLTQATFVEEDFSDEWVEAFLKENGIDRLPAIVFNTNNFYDGGQISPYLEALPGGEFSLAVGAKFNPFAKRSDSGFLILESSDLEKIKEGSYVDGNSNAQITWIEYSDLECPFCAKLHNDGTSKIVMEKYGEDLNMIFQHFPLDFHPNALPGAEALECIAEQNVNAFYPVIEESFKVYNNNNFSLSGFYDIAAENGVDKNALEACVDSGKYKDKVNGQMALGQSLFGVTGTPGNVIINNETGEYEVISGAYPASAFEELIDRMLK